MDQQRLDNNQEGLEQLLEQNSPINSMDERQIPSHNNSIAKSMKSLPQNCQNDKKINFGNKSKTLQNNQINTAFPIDDENIRDTSDIDRAQVVHRFSTRGSEFSIRSKNKRSIFGEKGQIYKKNIENNPNATTHNINNSRSPPQTVYANRKESSMSKNTLSQHKNQNHSSSHENHLSNQLTINQSKNQQIQNSITSINIQNSNVIPHSPTQQYASDRNINDSQINGTVQSRQPSYRDQDNSKNILITQQQPVYTNNQLGVQNMSQNQLIMQSSHRSNRSSFQNQQQKVQQNIKRQGTLQSQRSQTKSMYSNGGQNNGLEASGRQNYYPEEDYEDHVSINMQDNQSPTSSRFQNNLYFNQNQNQIPNGSTYTNSRKTSEDIKLQELRQQYKNKVRQNPVMQKDYRPKKLDPQPEYDNSKLEVQEKNQLQYYFEQREKFFDPIVKKARIQEFGEARTTNPEYMEENFLRLEWKDETDKPHDEVDLKFQDEKVKRSQRNTQNKQDPRIRQQNGEHSLTEPQLLIDTQMLKMPVNLQEKYLIIFNDCQGQQNKIRPIFQFSYKQILKKTERTIDTSKQFKQLIRESPLFQPLLDSLFDVKQNITEYVERVNPNDFEDHFWKHNYQEGQQSIQNVKKQVEEIQQYIQLCLPNSVNEKQYQTYQHQTSMNQIDNIQRIEDLATEKHINIENELQRLLQLDSKKNVFQSLDVEIPFKDIHEFQQLKEKIIQYAQMPIKSYQSHNKYFCQLLIELDGIYLNLTNIDQIMKFNMKIYTNYMQKQISNVNMEIDSMGRFLQEFYKNSQQFFQMVQYRKLEMDGQYTEVNEISDKLHKEILMPYADNKINNDQIIDNTFQRISSIQDKIDKNEVQIKQHSDLVPHDNIMQNLFGEEIKIQQTNQEEIIGQQNINKVLNEELRGFEAKEQDMYNIISSREQLAQKIQKGASRDQLKSVCSQLNKIQKQFVRIREFYILRGTMESKMLYPFQIQQLDGRITHELLNTEKLIRQIFYILEGEHEKDIKNIELILKDGKKKVEDIKKQISTHLHNPKTEETRQLSKDIQSILIKLDRVRQNEQQYSTNSQFVADCKDLFIDLLYYENEFKIWLSSCKVREFLEKEKIAELLANLTIVPVKNDHKSKQVHERYQVMMESMNKRLETERQELQKYTKDHQNAQDIIQVIENTQELTKPIFKNYKYLVKHKEASLNPKSIDIQIEITKTKDEAFRLLQNLPKFLQVRDYIYQAVESHLETNKELWNLEIEKLTIKEETSHILNFCKELSMTQEEASKYLLSIMKAGSLNSFFSSDQLVSRNLDILEDKFQVTNFSKELKNYENKVQDKLRNRQHNEEWIKVSKTIQNISYLFEYVKDAARLIFLVFHLIYQNIKYQETYRFDSKTTSELQSDLQECKQKCDRIDIRSIEVCVSDTNPNYGKEKMVMIDLADIITRIGNNIWNSLKDLQNQADQLAILWKYKQTFESKIFISTDKAKDDFVLLCQFQKFQEQAKIDSDAIQEAMPTQGEQIAEAMKNYLEYFDISVQDLYEGIEVSSYKNLLQDLRTKFKVLDLDFQQTIEKLKLDYDGFIQNPDLKVLLMNIQDTKKDIKYMIENEERMQYHLDERRFINNKIFNQFYEKYDKDQLQKWKKGLDLQIRIIDNFQESYGKYKDQLLTEVQMLDEIRTIMNDVISKLQETILSDYFKDLEEILITILQEEDAQIKPQQRNQKQKKTFLKQTSQISGSSKGLK